MAIRNYFVVFFLALTSTTCHARKKCSEVICPDVVIFPNDTVASLFLRYFDNEAYPQDGSCLQGKAVYRGFGKDWGRPGINRCGCIDDNALTRVAEPMECSEGIQQCHPVVTVFKEEPMVDFYKRIGQTYKNNVISDGCCPPNNYKYFLDPALSGLDKVLCYCEPANGNLVFNEGPVQCSSSSSED